MQLTDKRQNLKDELEKMNGDGSEAMTSKQVSDMERQLAISKSKHEKT